MPRAPIIEAMTTMASAIIVVWLMPCMIEGSASGIWTPLQHLPARGAEGAARLDHLVVDLRGCRGR